MAAVLHHLPLVQHDNPVHMANRAEPVRDDDAGATLEQPLQRVLDQPLGGGVYAARGLIQHQQHLGVEGQGPREGQQLPLPDREVRAPLAHLVVVAARQALDKRRRVHRLGGPAQLRVVDLGAVQTDIARNRAREADWVLWHRRDVSAQLVLPQRADIDAVQGDCALL